MKNLAAIGISTKRRIYAKHRINTNDRVMLAGIASRHAEISFPRAPGDEVSSDSSRFSKWSRMASAPRPQSIGFYPNAEIQSQKWWKRSHLVGGAAHDKHQPDRSQFILVLRHHLGAGSRVSHQRRVTKPHAVNNN